MSENQKRISPVQIAVFALYIVLLLLIGWWFTINLISYASAPRTQFLLRGLDITLTLSCYAALVVFVRAASRAFHAKRHAYLTSVTLLLILWFIWCGYLMKVGEIPHWSQLFIGPQTWWWLKLSEPMFPVILRDLCEEAGVSGAECTREWFVHSSEYARMINTAFRQAAARAYAIIPGLLAASVAYVGVVPDDE